MTSAQFIEKAKKEVLASNLSGALFPSLAIAQAALESGYGKSGLAAKHNNYFGIKASSSWKGPVVNMKTGEVLNKQAVVVNANFRVYTSLTDSIADRNNFLEKNSRYRLNGVFDAKTPEDQARALQKSGYATDPNYANKLIAIIKQWNLKEVDKKAAEVVAEKKNETI